MGWVLFAIVVLCAVIALTSWVTFQLFLQNGRILSRLDALEGLVSARAAELTAGPGLSVGTPAPDFELPDLVGRNRSLSEWRGQRVLLVFFDPRSAFCEQMLPALASLPLDGAANRPVPIILAMGEAVENRLLVEKYDLRSPVLMQDGGEVTAAYQVGSAPSGYLIGENGVILAPLAVGQQALMVLAGEPPALPGNGHAPRPGFRSLDNSHIKRDGLAAGTQAPLFRLPRLDGTDLSLVQYRGRRVLLVFSDPGCGPCNDLMPKLERLHRQSPGLEIVMVSRGDLESNRVKVAEYDLTFPVVLQRHWEVSRDYAMFATPIGYMIDEWGVIAADVALGVDAILALASVEQARVVEESKILLSRNGAAPAA